MNHGMCKHPLYLVWQGIRERCNRPYNSAYEHYGGRGIKICEEWDSSFKIFYEWAINNGWKYGLEIDRIDNNGNYCPENCRFVTIKENSRNRRSSVKISAFGETKTLIEWSEDPRCKVKYATLWHRLATGSSPEGAMSIEINRIKQKNKIRKPKKEY